VGPIHLVPWSGTSARAISTLQTDAIHIFNPNLTSIFAGVLWVLFVAYYWGKKEQNRLGIQQVYVDEVIDSTEKAALKRPKLLLFNTVLTIGLIIVLMKGIWPTPVLFLVGAMIALIVNYPLLAEQSKVLKSHGGNIFSVSSMIFAAGVFSGILTGSKMIEAMAEAMVSAVPAEHASLIPVLTAITSVPASLLFTPDAYYFGVVPVLAKTMVSFGLDPLQIGRAALLGQMTVGFPLSPLTASTFLLISLTKVELGEHQKNVFFWALGTSLVMTIVAILTGSISL
jgi:CitMHS family citrate-Mg2+:H+ or citrate-Ca2+:H+ symporter